MSAGPHGADLHLHTVYSDGAYTPERLVAAAVALDVRTLAVTDHDSLEGVEPVRRAAESATGAGLEVIAGAEFGTATQDTIVQELHIVGLFLDPACEELQAALRRFRQKRHERAEAMVEKLNRMGIELRLSDVLRLAGSGNVGRVHIARALVEAGRVRSLGGAFKRWLGQGGPAYVPRERPTPEETITLIHRAGGVAVMAHPGKTERDEEIPRLAAAGLDGIEVYCPDHSPSQEKQYTELVRQHGLLAGGGSDCHGAVGERVTLGRVRLDDKMVEALRARARSAGPVRLTREP